MMDTTNTLDSVGLKSVASVRESLSDPLSFRTHFEITLQRLIGWILLLPFTYFIVFLLRFLRGYEIEGLNETRKEFRKLTREKKPLVICANHLTFIDSVILIWAFSPNWRYFLTVRRFPWNLPAGDFFKKKFIYRVIAYLSKCIFIHRDGSKTHKNEVLSICHHLLKRSEIVMLFPEGRRSRTGKFDKERVTFGVGKLLKSVPDCRVLCVYVRGDRQRGFSNYPPKHSKFKVLTEVIVPQTDKQGKQAYFELTSPIAETIQKLEQKYLHLSKKSYEDLLPLKQTALVTGASEGIGRALSLELANQGYHLILVARNAERLEILKTECENKFGSKVNLIVQDLSDPNACKKIEQELHAHRLHVDLLVNNAGFGVHGKFEETPIESELSLLQVQLPVMAALTKLVLPYMIKKKAGKILNVGSVYSFSPVPQQTIYSACKAFMLSFTESLASEVKPHGIQVSLLCPGVTHTEFRKRAAITEKKLDAGMSAKSVAEIAIKGLRQGKRIIIPGRVNRIFVSIVRHLNGSQATFLLNTINRARKVNQ